VSKSSHSGSLLGAGMRLERLRSMLYREARMLQDHELQLQAQQIANQQFANSMNAWANYMQAVNARQPQAEHLTDSSVHCTSTSLGNTVNTNCN
jgi:hypothetical protein